MRVKGIFGIYEITEAREYYEKAFHLLGDTMTVKQKYKLAYSLKRWEKKKQVENLAKIWKKNFYIPEVDKPELRNIDQYGNIIRGM